MFAEHLRNRLGRILGRLASRYPRLTRMIRLFGIPMSVYMPILPLPTRLASLAKNDFNFALGPTKDSFGLAEVIRRQSELNPSFQGKERPIRISHIRKPRTVSAERLRLISNLWPGDSYTFDLEDEYLKQYEKSHYAFSPRKGGWDTMRTTEIVFSGSIPIIPKLGEAHPLALYGYPKDFLIEVWELAKGGRLPVPRAEDHRWLMQWALKHLTSQAQAEFVIRESGFTQPASGKVLFIDLGLLTQPDYVSMGVLVGLHRAIGDQLLSFHAPDFLVSRNVVAPAGLYGKGFGYFGELRDSELIAPNVGLLEELIRRAQIELRKGTVALLVVCGLESLDSVPELRREYLDSIVSGAWNSALVYGGDSTLQAEHREYFTRSATLFLREF